MANVFFTIGHSDRSIEDFIGLLREAGVTMVADVRTIPRSRANPQFNSDALACSLAARGFAYKLFPKLGGLRSRSADCCSPNDWWENKSFRNYADYALTDDFASGLAELRTLGDEQTIALMCAEAVWWRCHRRIIADYLIAAGENVRHILGPGHIAPAEITPAARPANGGLVYSQQGA